jgi:hypothetical protein
MLILSQNATMTVCPTRMMHQTKRGSSTQDSGLDTFDAASGILSALTEVIRRYAKKPEDRDG